MSPSDRILVIDDDPLMCDALTLVLKAAGYAVEIANTGRGGLEAFTRRSSDAVLLDLRLPDLHGLDVLRAIKAIAPSTDVIVMTGYGTLPTAIQAMDSAASGYLEKPVATDRLLATVGRLLTHRRAEAAASALAAVGHELAGTLELAEVTDRIAATVLRLFDVRRAALYTCDATSGPITCLAIAGEGDPATWIGRTLPSDTGVAGRAITLGHAVRTTDLLNDPRLTLSEWLRQQLEAERLRAATAVPLVAAGETLGALTLADVSGRNFTDDEVRLLGAFADQAVLALRNARLYDEVRRTRDFLQSIAQNSADAIVTTDPQGRITYVSPGAETMFGYKPDEVMGLRIAPFYRGGRAEARAVTQRLTTEGQIRNYETALRAKDGRWIPVSASISLLRDPQGTRTGTLGVIKDMTGRESAEAARREASELRAITLLAGAVAHEINNPLAVIVGQLELLALDLPTAGEGARRIQQALAAAENVRATVTQMTKITRLHTAPGDDILDLRRSGDAEHSTEVPSMH